MGSRIKRDQIAPSAIITSPAKRAISTANIIADQIDFPKHSISSNSEIYEASASSLLKIINQFDEKHESYFMFGHNPGFTYLAELLTNRDFGNIPTCGVVGIQFELENWTMISSNTGNCIYYNYPKKES
jgi:phosphohistidine phosphatase